MQAFRFSQAKTVDGALDPESRFLAGGTTLIDLMKLDVETPARVVDINRLPLARVEASADGGLKVGALVRNSDLAIHPEVKARYAVLSEALLSGASPQLRNMATTGGNLLQRTRCYYFRDTAYACNKRQAGAGCSAMNGYNRIHAVLGGSEQCVATHASDMAVAMMALEAVVHTRGAQSGSGRERAIALDEFYLVPGTTPEREHVLEPGELITYVTLPKLPEGTRSHYVKLRDRAQYEFALASVAVVVTVKGDRVGRARIALGGVATKPWRSREAESALEGKRVDEKNFRAAAEAAMRGAKPLRDNGFKIELAKRALVRALTVVTA
ncbi:MAG: xanthine dehydrogenase family protein subunit M [Acidobacteriaceae bacterium]